MIIFTTQPQPERFLVGPNKIEFELLPDLTQIYNYQGFYEKDDLPQEIRDVLPNILYRLGIFSSHYFVIGIGNKATTRHAFTYLTPTVFWYYVLDDHIDGTHLFSQVTDSLIRSDPGLECLYFFKEANPR